ncbi:MAG TPA: hypothetical protein VJM84_01570 [Actinomycetota bacterium]|nr:hypothetical protein [Actinomycetota bacterium]
MKRVWDVPDDVRTVHLCACTLEHAEEIGAALEAVGIVWWVKPPSAGFLAFLDREYHVFVDRTRTADAAAIAHGIIEPPSGGPA